MKKFGSIAALAVGFVVLSPAVLAEGGQFFVDGGLGRSSYDLSTGTSGNDKNDWQSSLRAGYLWHGPVDYGVEFGYADLGQEVDRRVHGYMTGSDYQRNSTAANGWLLGGRLEYVMGQSWYVMARGGWFRPRITQELSDWALTRGYPWDSRPASGYSHDQSSFNTGNQTYFGLGIGYLITSHWRVGLNYDRYDLGSLISVSGYRQSSSYVNAYSASVQYRF